MYLDRNSVLSMNNLLCFWDFLDDSESEFISSGACAYQLTSMNGKVLRDSDGIFGPTSIRIQEGQWLHSLRSHCPRLNICGRQSQVTIMAWIKRAKQAQDHCEAVAGMWNETALARQYCLFLNLHIWDSANQVCGHVSRIGGPTPGYKYCMDAAIGATAVPFDLWQCVGFTYDGSEAKSYLNGQLDARPDRNPYGYEGGLFDGGAHGADFTVAAVDRSGVMGNWFAGALGGLAVFDRALSLREMAYMSGIKHAIRF